MSEVRKLRGWKKVGTKRIPGWKDPVVLRVRTSGAGSVAEFPKWASAFVGGFEGELDKIADQMEDLARSLGTSDPRFMTRFLEESERTGVHPAEMAKNKKTVRDFRKKYRG